MSDEKEPALGAMERRLDYSFKDQALLVDALTHNSAASAPGRSYQRLEFLGDAVLGAVAAELLCELFPDASEGELSQRKGRLVSRRVLASVARDQGFGAYLRVGRGEEQTDVRKNLNLLADVMESILGAVFLDGGWAPARRLARSWLESLDPATTSAPPVDHKTALQELTQGRWKVLPTYRLQRVTGPGHAQTFVVEVLLQRRVVGRGQGASRKAAEQAAAQEAMTRLPQAADIHEAVLDTAAGAALPPSAQSDGLPPDR